ncbi:hypothetical protein REC12_10555 [Desulfosporosinus sp. PR]|nr:hypothetical protein [Desulfosporosinus sp. PR]
MFTFHILKVKGNTADRTNQYPMQAENKGVREVGYQDAAGSLIAILARVIGLWFFYTE